jgi:hypothetical protein
MFFRDGKPQPDNYEGLKAGKLAKVSDPSGLTVEGLQVKTNSIKIHSQL